jgi:hypothetical protein
MARVGLGQSRSGGVRVPLVLVSGALALLFAWAAWQLPSRPGTWLGALAALLAAAHAATLVVAALWPEQLARPWRALSWLSLCAGTTFAAAIGWTSVDLVRRFGSLGWGVSALLAAIGVLLLLATWPFAAWGLRATRKLP